VGRFILIDEGGGYLFDVILEEAKESLVDALDAESKNPDINRSPQSRGTRAHANLKNRLRERLRNIDKILARIDARMDVEVFVHGDGTPVDIPDLRPKGSKGIDIAIYKPAKSVHPLLLIDLKTGRGYSKAERNRVLGAFSGSGAMVEIFVHKRK
jgi:hypothetical protein